MRSKQTDTSPNLTDCQVLHEAAAVLRALTVISHASECEVPVLVGL